MYAEACPECGSTNLILDYDTGETVCKGCGLVVHDYIMDRGPEWRAYTREERELKRRVGTPNLYSVHDKGLSTMLGRDAKDARGHRLPLSTRRQILRLRRWQARSRVHSSEERNLAQAMAELDRLSDKLNVPGAVKERAAVIYRKALDKGIVRGRSITAITAASLYAACRSMRAARTLNDIVGVSLTNRKELSRCYRLLLRELDLQMPLTDPITYVSKLAGKLDINGETQGLAVEIIREAKRRKAATGKAPLGLAAAALYLACRKRGEKRSQKDIAEAANITEVTIRNRYKSLERELARSKFLFPLPGETP